MIKRLLYICLLTVFAFCITACSDSVETDSTDGIPDRANPSVSGTESHSEPADRYTVVFNENETFDSETERIAAAHIDPYIKQAVKLMNTVRADKYLYNVSSCDYAARPKERDKIKDPVAVQMYDIMLDKISNFEDYRFDSSFAPGDLFYPAVTANDALRIDQPYLMLYCHMAMEGNVYSSSYYLPGKWLDDPCSDRELVKRQVRLFDCTVDRIIEKMPAQLTNMEKCIYFAFVLTAAVEYDYEISTLDHNFQAYDALVNGKALCGGYAEAFYHLCKQQDIACWYVRGEAPYELGYHAWNVIETADGPIYVDITWYDEEDIADSYRDGKTNYLFMTQEDYDYYEYIETVRR